MSMRFSRGPYVDWQSFWAKRRGQQAGNQTNRVGTEIENLHERVENLALICMAMWSLIEEKTDLTEDDLKKRVQTIDQADGVVDGKITRPAEQTCPECGNTLSKRFRRCLYCGYEAAGQAFFSQDTPPPPPPGAQGR
jgi:hypothetical protein